MVDSISGFSGSLDNVRASNFKNEQAKVSGFEDALKRAADSGEDEELMKAAREFESYFLQTMMKEMRNSIPKDGLIPKNNAEEIFTSMLDEEMSKEAAKGHGMGIAQMIYDQMTLGNRMVVPYAPGNGADNATAAAKIADDLMVDADGAGEAATDLEP